MYLLLAVSKSKFYGTECRVCVGRRPANNSSSHLRLGGVRTIYYLWSGAAVGFVCSAAENKISLVIISRRNDAVVQIPAALVVGITLFEY